MEKVIKGSLLKERADGRYSSTCSPDKLLNIC